MRKYLQFNFMLRFISMNINLLGDMFDTEWVSVMTVCSLIFFTLLKMFMPTGIIIVHSVKASSMNSSFVGLSLSHKSFPWVKIKHSKSVKRAFSFRDGDTGNLYRKRHQLICLVQTLYFSSYWMKCQCLSASTLNSLKCVA